MDRKQRGENWTAEEKEIFIDIMKDSARIIECKKTDTNSNKRKQAEWYKVQKKFEELTGKLRDVAQLKGFWRRTRMVAKKNVFQHRRALNATGGGERPPSPSQEEQKIMEMCPTDFVTEENDHDIDDLFYKNEIIIKKDKLTIGSDCVADPSKSTDIAGLSQQENRILMLDIKDEAQDEETSFYEEIIVENMHNTEVTNKRARRTSMLESNQEKNTSKKDVIMSTPNRPQQSIDRIKNCSKTKKSHKTSLINTNIEIKDKTFKLLEEEYALKLQYQRQELCHQDLRHKLEIEILMLEKEKKEWELKLLKK